MRTITLILCVAISGCLISEWDLCPPREWTINLSQSEPSVEDISYGVVFWNAAANKTIIRTSDTEGQITIQFVNSVNGSTWAVGATHFVFNKKRTAVIGCNIVVLSGISQRETRRIIAHELGHCLLIPDDYEYNTERVISISDPGSIMATGWEVRDDHLEKINSCYPE